ncbi:UNVERIFIED_CONTAM: hypothetical protein PYX00_006949 [Menopon gallinae]|uniref:Uncharacterized protein n=1 Tax=Menopon gallinae TaxID=328185 RepID=A0AAW2HGU2_9NEOP
MVCKKSLYCLKNGPCANYQIRKQIWEDNIRFRESLRNINQSDHYWSFQISNNDYSDFDEPSFHRKKNKSFWKYRNCYDCASVTHDFTPNNSCTCNLKPGDLRRYSKQDESLELKDDTPETKALLIKPSKQIQTQPPSIPNQRLSSCTTKNVSELCHKYRNSLSSAQLQPSTKVKFSSQSTLVQPKRSFDIRKFPSMEVISKLKDADKDNAGENKLNTTIKQLSNVKLGRKKEIKLPPWLSGTPLSRTTRKMLLKDKQVPFTSFGCNNSNDVVGSKRTHNVFASTKEIFPNALSAKQQREEMIARSIKNERLFRNSLLQDNSKKMINHSSLWATEGIKDVRAKNACSVSRKK